MAEKKRGCLGCSFPILILVVIIFLAITAVGFLSGPVGQGFLTKFGATLTFPAWLTVPQPVPHLPAPVLFHIWVIPVTNTILAAWFTVLFLVLLSWAVTRRMKLVPGRLQVAFEFLLGWMYDFCLGVAGEHWARRFFPVVCTIFLFVLFNAWLSLIPGFGSFLYKEYEPVPAGMQVVESAHVAGEWVLIPDGTSYAPEAEVVTAEEGHGVPGEVILKDGEFMIMQHQELIRGANTDVNTPLAIAIISFFFVAFFGFKALGAGWAKQYLNFGPFFCAIGRVFRGKFSVMDIFSGFVDAFVGLLELLSLFIRIISFTFRLFGNMTAGEILLVIVAFLVPYVLALPFYGLELLIGFVQALVFAGLTLVFVTMAVTPHGGESH